MKPKELGAQCSNTVSLLFLRGPEKIHFFHQKPMVALIAV
jgi:hypothetical protein